MRAYNEYNRAKHQHLLDGPHGDRVRMLKNYLRTIQLDDVGIVVERVRGAGWMQDLPREDRRQILHIISRAIVSLREKQGLMPFEDSLELNRPTPFEEIKAILLIQ